MKKRYSLFFLLFLTLLTACSQASPATKEEVQKAPASQALFSADKSYEAKVWTKDLKEGKTEILRVEYEGDEIKAFASTIIVPVAKQEDQSEKDQVYADFYSQFGDMPGVEPRVTEEDGMYYMTYVVYMERFDWGSLENNFIFPDFMRTIRQDQFKVAEFENYAKANNYKEVK